MSRPALRDLVLRGALAQGSQLIRNEGRGRVLDATGWRTACECFRRVQDFNRRVLGELA